MSGEHVHFARLPMSLPCPVKVRPGTPDTLDADGGELPDRTEYCAIDAFWMIGAQVTCDVHLRQACGLLGIDYDGILQEASESELYDIPAREVLRQWRQNETIPWAERRRYAQGDVRA